MACAFFGLLEFSCSDNTNLPFGPPIYPDIDCCPSWSPDGSKILYYHKGIIRINDNGSYSVDHNFSGIWTIDTLGQNTQQLLNGNVFYPDWSPDGNWIAFESGAQIYKVKVQKDTVDIDSIQQLTFEGRNFFPSWDPSGEWIAYDNTNCGSAGDPPPPPNSCGILIVKSDGSNRRFVTRGRMPDWSPGGYYLIYIGFDDSEVYRVNVNNTSQIKRLTFFNEYSLTTLNRQPKYSPDGNFIAFQSKSQSDIAIWTMNSDGTNLSRLISGANPAWSPDAVKIALNYSPPGSIYDKGTIWILNIGDTTIRQLTRGPY